MLSLFHCPVFVSFCICWWLVCCCFLSNVVCFSFSVLLSSRKVIERMVSGSLLLMMTLRYLFLFPTYISSFPFKRAVLEDISVLFWINLPYSVCFTFVYFECKKHLYISLLGAFKSFEPTI